MILLFHLYGSEDLQKWNPKTGDMPHTWGRNGKNGYRFDGGLSICGRKMRPQKEIIIITHNQEQTS